MFILGKGHDRRPEAGLSSVLKTQNRPCQYASTFRLAACSTQPAQPPRVHTETLEMDPELALVDSIPSSIAAESMVPSTIPMEPDQTPQKQPCVLSPSSRCVSTVPRVSIESLDDFLFWREIDIYLVAVMSHLKAEPDRCWGYRARGGEGRVG